MTIIQDYFMMTVDQRYESVINEDGILTLSTSWVNDTTVERFAYKRCYGKIVACPQGYSENTVEIIDPGVPNPRLHISGEYIEQKVKKGYNEYGRKNYQCAGLDAFEVVTVADIAKETDIRVGDKCYFDPRITEPHNMLGMHKGHEMYKIRVDEVLCIVRDGEILMQADWCLIAPEKETWEQITTKAGIITKPNPENIYLFGKMKHMRNRQDLKENDPVFFFRGAEWMFNVEGTEYYAVQGEDILCKLAS